VLITLCGIIAPVFFDLMPHWAGRNKLRNDGFNIPAAPERFLANRVLMLVTPVKPATKAHSAIIVRLAPHASPGAQTNVSAFYRGFSATFDASVLANVIAVARRDKSLGALLLFRKLPNQTHSNLQNKVADATRLPPVCQRRSADEGERPAVR
jgi:hypothetical protein